MYQGGYIPFNKAGNEGFEYFFNVRERRREQGINYISTLGQKLHTHEVKQYSRGGNQLYKDGFWQGGQWVLWTKDTGYGEEELLVF